MNYFIKLGHIYTAQNNLQKDIGRVLGQFDKKMVDRPEDLIEHLRQRLAQCSRSHPRCTPLAIDYNPAFKSTNATISVGALATFTLYKNGGLLQPPAPALPERTDRPNEDGVQLQISLT